MIKAEVNFSFLDFFRWDTREKPNEPKTRVENAHSAEINALVFSPANEFILCTASSDKVRLNIHFDEEQDKD